METDPIELTRQNDELVDIWAPYERDNWPTSADTDETFVGLHRTALIALARARQAQAAAETSKQVNTK